MELMSFVWVSIFTIYFAKLYGLEAFVFSTKYSCSALFCERIINPALVCEDTKVGFCLINYLTKR
jgi:hypothetical protein